MQVNTSQEHKKDQNQVYDDEYKKINIGDLSIAQLWLSPIVAIYMLKLYNPPIVVHTKFHEFL